MAMFLFNLCFFIYFIFCITKFYKDIKKDLNDEQMYIVLSAVGFSLALICCFDFCGEVFSSFLALF